MKTSRLHSCNILHLRADSQQFWAFDISDGEVTKDYEGAGLPSEPLPARLIAKDWRTLWRRKLNLAWLPADRVFLRAIQLPSCELSELLSMIELQLEKLSPLPLAQIVWTVEVMPGADGAMQTAVVIIAQRDLVEDFLGRIEGQGYMADRLELPMLHQLLADPIAGNAVWIHPSTIEEKNVCLVAWWQEGVLRNLNLIHVLESDGWADALKEQLTQIAWAGEVEGWISQPLKCRLVAARELAPAWETPLGQWSRQSVDTVAPLAPLELAALNVKRVANKECKANLIPPEFATRYKQQYVDRLWMRGLGALLAVYVAGVLIYFAGLQFINFQHYRIESKIAALSQDYRDAMELRTRLEVIQNQVNLKYAALESWKAAATLLPKELSLTDLSFQQGKILTLHGMAAADQVNKIIDYNQALSKYRVMNTNGPLLFSKVQPYNSTTRPGAAGVPMVTWNFSCELNQTEVE